MPVLRFARDRKAGAIKNLLGRTRRRIHLVKKGRDQETARSVVVIDNSGTRDDLRRRVDEVWKWIETLPRG